MSETNFEIKINVPMIKELVSDKIYRSDASAFREQYVNALSHGCVAYHQEHGYTDDVFVHVLFDYGARKVTITDNGMGMTKNIFSDNFMSFGFSTVDKETNNTRSGMFGLGAISFFRIASACIVESWDRRTNERFCFMTRNTDESEFVANRTLDGFGTRTEISLKEHVRIPSLVEMVQTIASNYPVKTVLEIVNSESEQTISTYNTNDNDSYNEFAPVMRFKDYVKERTNDRFVTLVDNEQMELYLSTIGGNRNSTFLCRIPIDISYSTGFTTYLNIKQEKIRGEDKNGKEKLQEVPKPDRDEVNEIATEYFAEVIEKACNDMIHDIDITSFEEYETSDKRWVLNGYSIDDRLNHDTHSFVQKMRTPVRYRTSNGIQKRHETLLTLFGEYQDVMFHPSLHKGTFDAIDKHLRDARDKKAMDARDPEEPEVPVTRSQSTLVLVDDHCSQPLVDAKEYKKKNKIKSLISKGSSGGGSPRGLLVRDGSWNNYRITTDDEDVIDKLYPGGIYFADDMIGQHQINNIGEDNRIMRGIQDRHKAGIVIAKKGKKLYPSIKVLFDEILAASKNGQIIFMKTGNAEDEQYQKIDLNYDPDEDAVELNEEGTQRRSYAQVISYFSNLRYTIILPIQAATSLPFLRHANIEVLFMPAKLIHAAKLLGYASYNTKEMQMINQLKYVPNWTKWDDETSAFVWSKYLSMCGRYGEQNYECRAALMNWFAAIHSGIVERPDEDEYRNKINKIVQEYGESTYDYNLEFEKIFPTKYLESKARNNGWDETVTQNGINGNEEVYGLSTQRDYTTPIEIDGKYYAVSVDDERTSWQAVIDEDGNPRLVYTANNYDIVKHKGKLMFKEKMSRW